MTTARYQNGCISKTTNGSGISVWIFRWYEILPDGERVQSKKQIGTLDQYKTKASTAKAAIGLKLAINSGKRSELSRSLTMNQLVRHFREKELVDRGDEGRAWSTRDRYDSFLRTWIEPRWVRARSTRSGLLWSKNGYENFDASHVKGDRCQVSKTSPRSRSVSACTSD